MASSVLDNDVSHVESNSIFQQKIDISQTYYW